MYVTLLNMIVHFKPFYWTLTSLNSPLNFKLDLFNPQKRKFEDFKQAVDEAL